jgi:Fe-S-cluster containining protein
MPTSDKAFLHALRSAVRSSALRPDVRNAIDEIYRDLAVEIEKRRPICIVSGRCCRFDEFGHRLYVTTAELAVFWSDFERLEKSAALRESIAKWDGKGCPFQVAKMCGVHALRPFGCRVFFCDATSTQWQNEAYELFHARLKRLHQDLEVPYFYVEWREAMRAVGDFATL